MSQNQGSGRRWTSRKFLLALLGQVVGLLVLLLPEHQDAVTAAATNIGGLLLMAGTAAGFIHAEGKLDAASTEAQSRTEATRNAQTDLIREQQYEISAMRERIRAHETPFATPPGAVALLLLAVTAGLTTGCQGWGRADALQKYAVLQDSYIATVQALIEARRGGLIAAEDWTANVLPLIRQGDALLDEIGAAAKAGKNADAQIYIDALKSVLRELLRARGAYTSGATHHGTSPTHRPHRQLRSVDHRGVHPQPGEPAAAGRSRAARRARAAPQGAGRAGRVAGGRYARATAVGGWLVS